MGSSFCLVNPNQSISTLQKPCPGEKNELISTFTNTPPGAIMRLEVNMAKRKGRRFTAEFKADAVRLVQSGGQSIGLVAMDLDLTETTLQEWVRRAEIEAAEGRPVSVSEAERAELIRLRQENKRLQMECEILNKATAFFAKENE
jgi:transposase-like protein